MLRILSDFGGIIAIYWKRESDRRLGRTVDRNWEVEGLLKLPRTFSIFSFRFYYLVYMIQRLNSRLELQLLH